MLHFRRRTVLISDGEVPGKCAITASVIKKGREVKRKKVNNSSLTNGDRTSLNIFIYNSDYIPIIAFTFEGSSALLLVFRPVRLDFARVSLPNIMTANS